MSVQALYVDPRGPYPALLGIENCWDEARDARQYAGPGPVVAHPPCGPWSKLRHLCNAATLATADCGPRAFEQVRTFGGVLEHPANSLLWPYMGYSGPGDATDAAGGRTYMVNQVDWGHCCVKPTWLYVVGVDQLRVMRDIRARRGTGAEPTHCICTGPRQLKRLPVASKPRKRRSPPTFAEWLIKLASSAEPRA